MNELVKVTLDVTVATVLNEETNTIETIVLEGKQKNATIRKMLKDGLLKQTFIKKEYTKETVYCEPHAIRQIAVE